MGDISVLIDTERYDSALTGLRALVAEVRQYPGLPIAVVDEGITDDQALRAVPGVVGVEPLSPDRRSILTGLDRASLMAAGRSTPWTVGGVDAGGDYPSLLDGPQGSIAPPAVCAVVNLSLGERDDALVPTSPDDSVVHALEHLSRTVVCVVAAGNGHNARYDFETLSPWAESPAVLSVGATVDEDGTELAPYSARGSALRPELGPDVLAWGRSAVAPHPPGTSFAAARVSAMVAFARAWLWNVRANVDLALGRPTGVPLVGVFVIDIGFMSDDRQYSPPAPWAALPLIGALAGELDPLVTIADELITAHASRQLIEAAASATSPSGLTSPSITTPRLHAWLDGLSAHDLADVLTDNQSAATTERHEPLFAPGTAERLELLFGASMPIWEFEIPTSAGRMRHDVIPPPPDPE